MVLTYEEFDPEYIIENCPVLSEIFSLNFKANALTQAQRFSIENIVPQYEALYKKLL